LVESSTTINNLPGQSGAATDQPTTIYISYDGDGNRVKKTVTTPTNTVTTYYVVDDQNPTGYAQVLEEHVSINNQPSAINRVYSYGHTLISQDRLDGSTWRTSFYGYDGHNNVRYLTDLNGTVTDTYDFDAFGNLITRTGDTPNNYLYCGEQYDSDLGLYCLRARYHNPDTGRFWTQDSYEGFGEDPMSLHKYTYGSNNPANACDPSGNMTLLSTLTAVSIAANITMGFFDLWRAVTAKTPLERAWYGAMAFADFSFAALGIFGSLGGGGGMSLQIAGGPAASLASAYCLSSAGWAAAKGIFTIGELMSMMTSHMSGGKGIVDAPNGADPGEVEFAEEFFAANGYDVNIAGPGAPKPDFTVSLNGLLKDVYQYKQLTTSSPMTVAERINEGFNAAGGALNVILDLRKSPLTLEEVLRGYAEAVRRGWVKEGGKVRFVTKGGKDITL
jgi:RHS repeat-associated protein